MTNKIMELAYHYAAACERRALVSRVEARLNLATEVQAHVDYTRAVIRERDALRKEVELQKYNVDTWYERFMEAAKRCHELQALDAARAALENP